MNINMLSHNDQPVDVKLFDLNGKLLWHNDNVKFDQDLHIGSELELGCYLIQIASGVDVKVFKVRKVE